MRNSLLWIVSSLLSVAAHYGLIAAAAHIPLPAQEEEQLADIILGGEAFQPASLDAGSPASALDNSSADARELSENDSGASSLDASSTGSDVEAAAAAQAEEPAQPAEQLPQSVAADIGAGAAQSNIDPSLSASDVAASTAAPDVTPAGAAGALASSSASAALAPEAATGVAPPETATANLAPSDGLDVAQAPAPETALAPQQQAASVASGDVPVLDGSSQVAAVSQVPPQTAAAEQSLPAVAPAAPADVPPSELPAAGSGGALVAQSPAVESVEIAAVPGISATSGAPAQQTNEIEIASAATTSTQTMSQAERVAAFVQNYQGSGCVLAVAENANAANPRLRGIGAQGGPVEEFVSAFRKSVGVDPSLALDLVRDAQCPAVDFIRSVGGPTPDLNVKLDRDVVPNGKILIGRIEGPLAPSVQLLIVDDDGAVRDISKDFHLLPKGNFFGVGIKATGEGKGRNQLILAISSMEPLALNITRKPGEAIRVFEDIARLATSRNLRIMTAYAAFRIE